MMNKKYLSCLILLLITVSLIFAQVDLYSPTPEPKTTPQFIAYFNAKKINGGIMLGVEIINTKTGKSTFTNKSADYIFRWSILTDTDQDLSKKTFTNTVFFLITDQTRALNSFNVKLEIYPLVGSNQPLYTFSQKIVLPEPQVQILRKSLGLLLPLTGQLNENDSLVFVYDNFISPPNQFLWYFNDVFVSNKRELTLSDLPDKTGILKLQIFSKLKERAVDVKSIRP